jgi:hypothetical protein
VDVDAAGARGVHQLHSTGEQRSGQPHGYRRDAAAVGRVARFGDELGQGVEAEDGVPAVGVADLDRLGLAVAQRRRHRRERHHPGGQHGPGEQGVDQRGLAALGLAGHHHPQYVLAHPAGQLGHLVHTGRITLPGTEQGGQPVERAGQLALPWWRHGGLPPAKVGTVGRSMRRLAAGPTAETLAGL